MMALDSMSTPTRPLPPLPTNALTPSLSVTVSPIDLNARFDVALASHLLLKLVETGLRFVVPLNASSNFWVSPSVTLSAGVQLALQFLGRSLGLR
jgi:hypothetical protein